VPEKIGFQTKPELALDQIRAACAAGLPRGVVLMDAGYGVDATGGLDPRTEFVVRAFQRHFRPERVDGRIDQSTITTLQHLLAALPGAGTAA